MEKTGARTHNRQTQDELRKQGVRYSRDGIEAIRPGRRARHGTPQLLDTGQEMAGHNILCCMMN